MKKSRYTRYFKYPLDCLIAAFLILLTSPVLLSTILLLAIANRGSGIFFLQERPGKNGKIFTCNGSPNTLHATTKPAWLKNWKNWASGALLLTLLPSVPYNNANT